MSLQHGSNSIHLSPGNLVISGAGAILLSKVWWKISRRKKTKKNLMYMSFLYNKIIIQRNPLDFHGFYTCFRGFSLGIRWNAETKLLSWSFWDFPAAHLPKVPTSRRSNCAFRTKRTCEAFEERSVLKGINVISWLFMFMFIQILMLLLWLWDDRESLLLISWSFRQKLGIQKHVTYGSHMISSHSFC